jgi:DNA-binding MarR family transcriptional regulator
MAAQQQGLLNAAAAIDRIAQAHRTAAAAALRELGVSESTASLLWLLNDNTGCTMSRAAEQLSCDRSNITLLAIQLEKRGFVERTADPLDARRRNLRLTPDGQDAATRLRDAVATGSPLRHLNPDACAELGAILQASLAPNEQPLPSSVSAGSV